ncbi:hypothetical protein D3C72_831830 [compost metagenome]
MGVRVAPATPMARSLPLRTSGRTVATALNMRSTSPAARPIAAGLAPLYGTWVIFTPASLVK